MFKLKDPLLIELADEIEHNQVSEKLWALSPMLSVWALMSALLSYLLLPHTLIHFFIAFFSSNALVWVLGLKFYPRKKVLDKKFIHLKQNETIVWQKINQFSQFLSTQTQEENNAIIKNIYYIILLTFLKPLDINLSLSKIEYDSSYFYFPQAIGQYFTSKSDNNYCEAILSYLKELNEEEKHNFKHVIDSYFGYTTCYSLALISGNVFLFKILNLLYDNQYMFDMDIFNDSFSEENQSFLHFYAKSRHLEKNAIYQFLIENKSLNLNSNDYKKILSLYENTDFSISNSKINSFLNSLNHNQRKDNSEQKSSYLKQTKNKASQHENIPNFSSTIPTEVKIIKTYYYDEFNAMRYELMAKIKHNIDKTQDCSDSIILSSMLHELNFIIQAINEEQYLKINTYFNLIQYIQDYIPELIDERIKKDSDIHPEWEYQYHEQIKQIRHLILQTQHIVFNYSFSEFSSLKITLKAILEEMQESINSHKNYIVNDNIHLLLKELSFMTEHINEEYYNSLKNGFNMIYIIKYYLPTLIEQSILASFKKQNNYYLTSEIESLLQRSQLAHEIIVNNVSEEYNKNANALFNKYAEFNFTYLRINQ